MKHIDFTQKSPYQFDITFDIIYKIGHYVK